MLQNVQGYVAFCLAHYATFYGAQMLAKMSNSVSLLLLKGDCGPYCDVDVDKVTFCLYHCSLNRSEHPILGLVQ